MQKVKPDMLSYIVSCSLPHQLFQKCFFCRQKLAGLGAESRHPQGSAWALTKDSKKRRFSHLFLPLLSSLKHPQPFWNQWLVSWKTTFPWQGFGRGMAQAMWECWGVADEASLTSLLLTFCCVAQFLIGHGLAPVCSPGVGDPWL